MKFRLTCIIALALILAIQASTSCRKAIAEEITVPIIAFDDDAEEDITGPDAGNVRRSSSDLEIGNENGILQWVGLRFQDIMIPADSTINSAAITFTGAETDVGVLIIPIVGEREIDGEAFSDLTPLTGRNLTNASVIWDIDPWFPNDNGPNTTTVDLSPIVQEIVNQSDWLPGGPMVFLIQNDPLDSSERLCVSFDGDPAQAAVLSVDFTPPTSTLLGDINLDGVVNLLDVGPFVTLITNGGFQIEADINQDGFVNLLDVSGFVDVIAGG